MAPETRKTPQMRGRAGKAHPRQRAAVGSVEKAGALRHWPL